MDAQLNEPKRHEPGPNHHNIAAFRDHELKKVGYDNKGSTLSNGGSSSKGQNSSPDYTTAKSATMLGASSSVIFIAIGGILLYAFFYRG